jgi:hypothetical protein
VAVQLAALDPISLYALQWEDMALRRHPTSSPAALKGSHSFRRFQSVPQSKTSQQDENLVRYFAD